MIVVVVVIDVGDRDVLDVDGGFDHPVHLLWATYVVERLLKCI